MRLLLFDWTVGGHHLLYLQRFSEALRDVADVVVAAPSRHTDSFNDPRIELFSLGDARPDPQLDQPLGRQHRELAVRELDLLGEVIRKTRPDHALHLYADPIIRRLVNRRPLDVPVSLLLFFPKLHHLRSLSGPLPSREHPRAYFLEYVIWRWRRRRDAHALLSLDELAVDQWRRSGASAYWIPEPPVKRMTTKSTERSGCVVYGALAPRKGLDLLARAMALAPTDMRITLAGAVEKGAETYVAAAASSIGQAGAQVDLRAHWHDELEGLSVLANARCAVLPYPLHYGMSRVLLEASSVGTPVIVHDFGLLAYLVRTHGLGQVVDCRDPRALRRVLCRMTQGDSAASDYAANLAGFADRYSELSFRQAARTPFHLN